MALYQPSNIIPSSFSGTGNGVVSEAEQASVSWMINGTSRMTGFQIQIYKNSDDSLVYDSTKIIVDGGVSGTDERGNPVQYTYFPQKTWSNLGDIGIHDGNAYKMFITQFWGDNQSVTQYSASYFISRTAPTLSLNNFSPNQTVSNIQYTFSATYTQAQSDAINWCRWMLAKVVNGQYNVIDDTGIINTGVLSYTANGLLDGNTYAIMCEVQTENGVTVSTGWNNFDVSYTNIISPNQLSSTCTADGAIFTDLRENIVLTGNASVLDGNLIVTPGQTATFSSFENGTQIAIANPVTLALKLDVTGLNRLMNNQSMIKCIDTVCLGSLVFSWVYESIGVSKVLVYKYTGGSGSGFTLQYTAIINVDPSDISENCSMHVVPSSLVLHTKTKVYFFSIDSVTNALTLVQSITVDSVGEIYYAKFASNGYSRFIVVGGAQDTAYYSYDSSNGSITFLGNLGFASGCFESTGRADILIAIFGRISAYGKCASIYKSVMGNSLTYDKDIVISSDLNYNCYDIVGFAETDNFIVSYSSWENGSPSNQNAQSNYVQISSQDHNVSYSVGASIPALSRERFLYGVIRIDPNQDTKNKMICDGKSMYNYLSSDNSITKMYNIPFANTSSYASTDVRSSFFQITLNSVSGISFAMESLMLYSKAYDQRTIISALQTNNASYSALILYSSALYTTNPIVAANLLIVSDVSNTRYYFLDGENIVRQGIVASANNLNSFAKIQFWGSNNKGFSSVEFFGVLPGNYSSSIDYFNLNWNDSPLILGSNFELNNGTISNIRGVNTTSPWKYFYRYNNGVGNFVYRVPNTSYGVKDFTLSSNQSYSFGLFFVNPSAPISKRSTLMNSAEICVRYNSYVLIEAQADADYPNVFHAVKSWRFGNNIVNGAISNNNSPSFLTNFTPYKLKQPMSLLGKSGSLQAMLSNVKNSSYSDSVTMMESLYNASASQNTFFLKDLKGNMYMVAISAPITQTINNKSTVQEVSVSLNWEEVGSMEGISVIQLPSDEGWDNLMQN